jgi:alkanesulfonate monooxygenase SsuD/methylene tetrahydromethanopterin reductase-like flavin-dependent oxidoreductase (luciferase family)
VPRIERLGYDSVWVRDHVVYRPHQFEDEDITFVEAFTVLALAAARSSRLTLGTATLIPFRHPIHTALLLGSLVRCAGGPRVLVGWGSGNDPLEFTATGGLDHARGSRLEEHVEVVRQLQTGATVSHHGRHYQFDDVRLAPPDHVPPFWYGGGSVGALERTVRMFDGLLASRIPRAILLAQMDQLERRSAEIGRERPAVGVVTLVSPAATLEQGLAAFDQERIRADTDRRFPGRTWPGGGLDGVMIAGPPDTIAEELRQFADLGVSHLVIDLRVRFDDWEATVHGFAQDVLPRVGRTAHALRT